MYEQVDFHFRYQPGNSSPYALLLKYLQPKRKGSKRNRVRLADNTNEQGEFATEQMILWALSAFWYPSACKALGEFNQAVLRQKAKNAIYQLLQQIYYLIQQFDLDPAEFVFPAFGSQSSSSVKSSNHTTSVAGGQNILVSRQITPDATPNFQTEPELVEPADSMVLARNEDDIALDQAFDN